MALKVEAGDEMDDELEELEVGEVAEIDARIQAFDTTANTITVLGLVIDVSKAKIEGLKNKNDKAENHAEDTDEEMDPSQLTVGQFVEVRLASATAPFSTHEVDVMNFDNEIEVKLMDENGNEVEDDAEDVNIDVKEAVKVRDDAGRVHTKVVKFHTTSSGSFTLRGLPTGMAKIFVKRDNGGKAVRFVKVRGDKNKRISMHLH